MATTLAEMITYVRSQTLVQADDVSSAVITQMLNAGLNQLSLAFSWPWLQETADLTTVADTQTVALPSDFRKAFVIIENDTRVKLQEITFEQFVEAAEGVYKEEYDLHVKDKGDGDA